MSSERHHGHPLPQPVTGACSNELARLYREPREEATERLEAHLDRMFTIWRIEADLENLRAAWSAATTKHARAPIEERAADLAAELEDLKTRLAKVGPAYREKLKSEQKAA